MRQCSWCSACPSHSSPHTLQAWVQACKVAFAISTSKAVWRERTLPVASHMSAQSRSRRMQRISICTFLLTEAGVGAGGASLGAVETSFDALDQRLCVHCGVAGVCLDHSSGVGHALAPFFRYLWVRGTLSPPGTTPRANPSSARSPSSDLLRSVRRGPLLWGWHSPLRRPGPSRWPTRGAGSPRL